MKKQALSILLAPVLILSMLAFPVLARDISESDVVEYFGVVEDWATTDLNIAGVDTTGLDLSAFEAKDADDLALELGTVESPAAVAEGDGTIAKTILNPATGAGTGTYVPCGNGKLNIVLTIDKEDPQTTPEGTGGNIKNAIYVKSIKIKNINPSDPSLPTEYALEECSVCDGGGKLMLNAAGQAVIKGTITPAQVYDFGGNINYDAEIVYAMGPTATDNTVNIVGGTLTPTTSNFCPNNNLTGPNGAAIAPKAVYEDCGGKLSFKVDVQVPADGPKFVVPSEIRVNNTVYNDYVCRYTLFGSSGYPFGGDYCAPGYQVQLKEGQRIRFEAIIPDLINPFDEVSSGATPHVYWRLGGTRAPILHALATSVPGGKDSCKAKIVPLAPLAPSSPAPEKPIEPSGWYNTRENAVVGLYQKCGRFAVMQIRLRNDGGETGYVALPGRVTVNGGTPISHYWLSSTEPEDGKVAIAPGEIVTLLGRIWLTNIPSQLNSNEAVNVSVNLPDHNLFMNGKLHSDKVNWRCY